MTSLDAHLSSINFSYDLEALKILLDTSQVKTTFWGSRVVEVKDFTGSVYLEDIAREILVIGRQRSDADDLLPEERIAGIEIARKLEGFYRISDTQIQNSNFFTKFFNWIREFSFIPYTTRFHIEETAEINFRGYSEVKFLEQFGGAFNAMLNHPASAGAFGPPLRILAREDRIRALLV
jgi:hypothetical protein